MESTNAVQTEATQRAVGPREPASIMPSSFSEAMRLAQFMASSQIIPRALQGKPSDVLVVMMTGKDLGLSPVQSLRTIHVIEGRPTLAAELMVALCQRAPECEYFDLVHSDNAKATYATKRRNSKRETTITYTIEDAQAAGLAGKTNWKNHPAAMLRARASSALARAVYPDATLGMMTDDEAQEVRDRGEEVYAREARVDDLNARLETTTRTTTQSAQQAEAEDAHSEDVNGNGHSEAAETQPRVWPGPAAKATRGPAPTLNELLEEQGPLPFDKQPEAVAAAQPTNGATKRRPAL